MVWEAGWNDPLTGYLASFASLIGDKRTGVTLGETVRGIIGAGSLVCERIAAHSPVLQAVHAALPVESPWPSVTWIMDSEMDDVAVWCTIWDQEEHLVVRAKHLDRLIEYQDGDGQWQAGHLAEARPAGPWLAQAQTEMVVARDSQKRPKAQLVTAEIRSRSIRVRYER
jgi:hypothetical protein